MCILVSIETTEEINMKYLLAGLTFIAVFAFFIALALGLVYAGSGVIEFGAELQKALYFGVLFGCSIGACLSFIVYNEVKYK